MPAPNKNICKSLAHGRSISCKSLLDCIRPGRNAAEQL